MLSMKLRKLIFRAKPMQAGRCCGPNMTTAASPAATPTALPYSVSLRMFKQARSTSSSSTKSID